MMLSKMPELHKRNLKDNGWEEGDSKQIGWTDHISSSALQDGAVSACHKHSQWVRLRGHN